MSNTDSRRHTPAFRGSYVHLDRPHKINDEGEPRYSILIVLDPDNDDHADYIETLEDWVAEVAEEKFGEVPRRLKSPIREGDDIGEEFEGMVCLNVGNTRKPGVVDADLEPIDDLDRAEELYSGAWYRVSIRPYAWEHKTGGKGVSFSLDNVMKVDDDEPIGPSAPAAEDDFADTKTAGRQSKRSRGRRK